jgi:hypothetical protein
MIATLFHPNKEPVIVSAKGLTLPDTMTGLVNSSSLATAATLLECPQHLVDILVCSPCFVVYSVFDCDGATNAVATAKVNELLGQSVSDENIIESLRGPVLALTA